MLACAKSSVNGTNGASLALETDTLRERVNRAIKTGGRNERRPSPFVPKTAPLIFQFCLRSSHERRRGAKAVS